MKLVHTQKCQLTNSIEVSCMLAKRSDELGHVKMKAGLALAFGAMCKDKCK